LVTGRCLPTHTEGNFETGEAYFSGSLTSVSSIQGAPRRELFSHGAFNSRLVKLLVEIAENLKDYMYEWSSRDV
jgi:hypothetical protein